QEKPLEKSVAFDSMQRLFILQAPGGHLGQLSLSCASRSARTFSRLNSTASALGISPSAGDSWVVWRRRKALDCCPMSFQGEDPPAILPVDPIERRRRRRRKGTCVQLWSSSMGVFIYKFTNLKSVQAHIISSPIVGPALAQDRTGRTRAHSPAPHHLPRHLRAYPLHSLLGIPPLAAKTSDRADKARPPPPTTASGHGRRRRRLRVRAGRVAAAALQAVLLHRPRLGA
uniref:Uncharacterized protein n=1 Tax=Aegilops tauschii subsp. strangulata TaxID=200361 RepID=A0A453PVV1_AEGTS